MEKKFDQAKGKEQSTTWLAQRPLDDQRNIFRKETGITYFYKTPKKKCKRTQS